MDKLNDRQLSIIEILKQHDLLSPGEIHESLGIDKFSRPTINRDLTLLLSLKLIKKSGLGRSVKYSINQNYLLKSFNIENYFKEDFRTEIIDHFNVDIFDNLNNIFTKSEASKIYKLNEVYKSKILGQTSIGFKKELERLTIEFSWKSFSIEGNTYTLLDTGRLLKENIKAPGHLESEAQMIINHKNALSFILENPVEKALIAVAMVSYIQPYEDGNKRTARMIGNTILLANNFIPISFVGVSNIEYKKAILLFYEQNSIVYLKQLFLEQYELSTYKYF